MKLIVGLVMLAAAMGRGREARVSDLDRAPGGDSRLMTTEVADVTATVEVGAGQADESDQMSRPPPAATDWQIACELKSGASVMFDRRSLRALGPMTLVRWAAPGDPRASEAVYTALVSCGEKSIEATWPGKRTGTRAGTCGRRLVEAVCEAAATFHPPTNAAE
jgi:hypothetical protein